MTGGDDLMRDNNHKFPIIPVAIVLIFAMSVMLFFGGITALESEDAEVRDGIAYLEALEDKDPAVVDQIRKDLYQQKLDAQRDALLEKLNNGTMDPFTMFQDYVLMGDSRAVGFWYRDFLEKGRVLADGGHTIRNIPGQMEKLVSLNPSLIFLCYGLNDISIGYWDTKEAYVAEYMDIVKQIQEALPDATIVVSSILPARDPAFQRSSKWRNIPEWSAALERACESNGILFANCDQLAEDHPNLWDPDGIHFREQFYPYWASCLVVTLLMEGAE
jgi:hypothetical protein